MTTCIIINIVRKWYLVSAMRECNYFPLITKWRVLKLIGVVGSKKVSTIGKIFTDYRLSTHFDLLNVRNKDTFIVPPKVDETSIQYYVTTD